MFTFWSPFCLPLSAICFLFSTIYLPFVSYLFTYCFFPDIDALKAKRNEEMETAGSKIDNLVEQCKQFFRADDGADTWKAYLEYIDELVIEGLLKTMAASIGYLLDETDPSLTQGILFEVKLELSEPDVIYVPPLDKQIVGNFYDKIGKIHLC